MTFKLFFLRSISAIAFILAFSSSVYASPPGTSYDFSFVAIDGMSGSGVLTDSSGVWSIAGTVTTSGSFSQSGFAPSGSYTITGLSGTPTGVPGTSSIFNFGANGQNLYLTYVGQTIGPNNYPLGYVYYNAGSGDIYSALQNPGTNAPALSAPKSMALYSLRLHSCWPVFSSSWVVKNQLTQTWI